MPSFINSDNILIMIVFLFFLYGFWSPYIKGKKYDAVVDGYAHPEIGSDKGITWVCRFSYKDEKGRRATVMSKRVYDTQLEAMTCYPKGTNVRICSYKEAKDDRAEQALVISDIYDRRKSFIYTAIAFFCCIALCYGFSRLDITFMNFNLEGLSKMFS